MYSITETTKSCSKCQEVKPFAEFHKDKRKKSGLHSQCKACEKVYKDSRKLEIAATTKTWADNNKERKAATNKTWYDNNKERRRAIGKIWSDNNKERKSATEKIWRLNNQEAIKAKDHRYHARKLNADDASVTTSYLLYLIDIQQHRCGYCFTTLSESPHLDHIQPLSKKGEHSIGNVIYTCQHCNLSKGAKLLTEWLAL